MATSETSGPRVEVVRFPGTSLGGDERFGDY
jgi:hypothetical protein